jgi:hypothetical protein
MLGGEILQAVSAEVHRGQVKHGVARSAASSVLTDIEKFPILAEELGEVATELTYDRGGDRLALAKELVQVAAVAAAWAESIYKQEGVAP